MPFQFQSLFAFLPFLNSQCERISDQRERRGHLQFAAAMVATSWAAFILFMLCGIPASAQEPPSTVHENATCSPSPLSGCDASEISRAALTRYWSDCLKGDVNVFKCLEGTTKSRTYTLSDEETYLNSTSNIAKIQALWSPDVRHEASIVHSSDSNRVALILNGQIRTFFEAEVQHSFRQFVLEPLLNHTMRVDVFVAVKYEMSYTWQYAKDGFSQADVIPYIDERFVKQIIEDWGLQTTYVALPDGCTQKYAQQLAFQSVVKTETAQSFLYNYVLAIRPDVAFTQPAFVPTEFVARLFWDFGFLAPRSFATVMCSEDVSWTVDREHVARCLSFLSPHDQIMNMTRGVVYDLHINLWATVHVLRHGILHNAVHGVHIVRPSNTTRYVYQNLYQKWQGAG
jgi:hypothetical protein